MREPTRMNLKKNDTRRTRTGTVAAAALLASLALFGAGPAAAAEEASAEEAVAEEAIVEETVTEAVVEEEVEEEVELDYDLSFRLLGTGAFVSGDVAQFQQRQRVPENFSGGIDDLQFSTEIAEDTYLEVEGRAILDNHDYLFHLNIENEDKGFLDVGYREYRTWYDGRGGYWPPGNAFFVEYDPQLGVDRGEAWAKGGLVLPSSFKLTVGYRYLFREGTKDSETWGITAFPSGAQRSIVPSRAVLDEDRHLVDIALERDTGTTQIGSALHYEYTAIDNRRQITQNPESPTDQRRITDRNNPDTDVWGTRVYGTRRLLEGKVTVSGAYAYNDIDMDLAGSRIYGADFNSSFSVFSPNRQFRDTGYFDLRGSSKMREHVGNVSMLASPFEDVQVLSALRIRGQNLDAHSEVVESFVGGAPTYTTVLDDVTSFSSQNEVSVAEDIEVRYKGINNLVLYARGSWEQNNNDLYENQNQLPAPGFDLERSTNTDRHRQDYSVGAKYYPRRWISLSTEYSYRKSDYDYRHDIDSTSNLPLGPPSDNRYPAFLERQTFVTHDINFSTTLRLPCDVSLVTRYDYMDSTIDSEAEYLSRKQSADTRSHVLGSTLNWNPANWWWTRGGVNYVHSTIDTAADNYNTPVTAFLRSFDNDYVMFNVASGMAIDERTDAEFLYTWTSADNNHDVSASSLTYGSNFEENAVRVQLARRLDDHTRLAIGYGYFNNDEAFAGGQYNYDAHLVTTSLEFEY